MLKFQRVSILANLVIIATLGALTPRLSLTAQAQTLKFGWPDGASAKVHSRSEGRRVRKSGDQTWDMSADFTMQIKRAGERIVISRDGFSGWKGTLPPTIGGGAERFIDMIPTFVVSADGAFIGIEGHDITRKLMTASVVQSGGLDPPTQNLLETISTNASLEAMASDHWSILVLLWEDVELDPNLSYELHNVTSVPQLGGGDLEINGTVKFVKEIPCPTALAERRCVQLHAETGADKAQVNQLIQALLRSAGVGRPTVTAWDQRTKLDIVVEQATMLPQQLTLTRINGMTIKADGETNSASEEITKTYTFAWSLPADERKRN